MWSFDNEKSGIFSSRSSNKHIVQKYRPRGMTYKDVSDDSPSNAPSIIEVILHDARFLRTKKLSVKPKKKIPVKGAMKGKCKTLQTGLSASGAQKMFLLE